VKKIVGMFLLLVGSATMALAIPIPAPEIDAGTAVNAIALLSGAVLVIQGSRRK
jgi:hypothetical protein